MKYLLTVALIALTSVVSANTLKTGHEIIGEVFEGYEHGEYQDFLRDLDKEYTKNRKRWKYNKLLEERKKMANVIYSMDLPRAKKADPLTKATEKLVEERNKKLTEIALKQPTHPMSQAIKDFLYFELSSEQKEALDYFKQLHYRFIREGKTPLENELINIDIEYWIKEVTLDNRFFEKRAMDDETHQKRRVALALEKRFRLLSACEASPEEECAVKINRLYEFYFNHLASVMDARILNSLSHKKAHPQDSFEEKIQAVMLDFVTKKRELNAKYFSDSQS